PRPRDADVDGHPEPRLLPHPGHLPLPDRRGAGREPDHRYRLRLHRPAHPCGHAGWGLTAMAQTVTIEAPKTVETPAPAPAHRSDFLSFAPRNWKSVLGSCLVGSMLLLALFGPLLADHAPLEFSGPTDSRPSTDYWFGTTSFGQDVYSQFVHGLRAAFL